MQRKTNFVGGLQFMVKNNKMIFLQLTQVVSIRIHSLTENNTAEVEKKIYVRPSAILAYKDKQVLLLTGWITVKETAEQICQQIYSSED